MNLECAGCGKHMGEVLDGRLRNGMAIYCAPCNVEIAEYLAARKEAQSAASENASNPFDPNFFDHLMGMAKGKWKP